MEIIHADETFNDLRVINRINSFDCEINLNGKSDFELKLPSDVWEINKIELGHIIYVPGTEFGGFVNRIKTVNKEVHVFGKTWRGHLNKNLIVPPSGQAYKVVNGNAKVVLENLLGNYFGSLFEVADSTVTLEDEFRYEEIGEGIEQAVSKVNARLQITQKVNSIELKVVNVIDWSDDYEFNEDYGVLISIDNDQSKSINHVVGLGKGELTNRLILEAWLLDDGTITYDSSNPNIPNDSETYTHKLDYPNAESEEKLKAAMVKIFNENKKSINTKIDFSGARLPNVELGDIVASRDRLTGIYAKQKIIKKIYKINNSGRVELRYDVKEV